MSENILIIKKVAKERLKDEIDFLFGKLDAEGRIEDKREIFIKPNLFCPEPANTGATVDLDLLGAVIDYFVIRGKSVQVGEAGAHQFDHEALFRGLGVYEFCSEHNAEFINLNLCRFREVEFKIRGKKHYFPVPTVVLDADFFVNVPKYKTHSATRVTLAMKNLYGLLPGKVKWRGHALGLNETLVELNTAVRPSDLVVTDAMIAMQGFGPTMGIPVRRDILIASNNAVVHDFGICQLQNFKGVFHVEMGIGDSPPPISFYFYDLDRKPISRRDIDLSIKLLPESFSRLWYKVNEELYKAGPWLEKLNLSPKKILNTLVTRKTIDLFRKLQSRQRA